MTTQLAPINLVLTKGLNPTILSVNINYSTLFNSYPEWWRDWPNETRQPVVLEPQGANSCWKIPER